MQYKRMLAIMQARFREFYRDTASWSWNLIMPVLMIIGFAFIFSGEPEDMFKVAVYADAETDQPASRFLATEYINFIEVDDLQQAVVKVQRHQFDMLLQLSAEPRYWINEHSSNGYVLEK